MAVSVDQPGHGYQTAAVDQLAGCRPVVVRGTDQRDRPVGDLDACRCGEYCRAIDPDRRRANQRRGIDEGKVGARRLDVVIAGGHRPSLAQRREAYDFAVAGNSDLVALMWAIGRGQLHAVEKALQADPSIARSRLDRKDEFFLPECHAHVYAGDTLLHAAAFAYDVETARRLVSAGADVRAKNRRGAEPLHAAMIGAPGSDHWNPDAQVDMITYLIETGADVSATASGGITPLHRAVRNRCSAAVEALVAAGADPNVTNDSGSTAFTLTHWTTGRGGTGSPEAKSEQERIVRILESAIR